MPQALWSIKKIAFGLCVPFLASQNKKNNLMMFMTHIIRRMICNVIPIWCLILNNLYGVYSTSHMTYSMHLMKCTPKVICNTYNTSYTIYNVNRIWCLILNNLYDVYSTSHMTYSIRLMKCISKVIYNTYNTSYTIYNVVPIWCLILNNLYDVYSTSHMTYFVHLM